MDKSEIDRTARQCVRDLETRAAQNDSAAQRKQSELDKAFARGKAEAFKAARNIVAEHFGIRVGA